MAITKTKRSVHLRQADRPKPTERRTSNRNPLDRFARFPHTRLFHFPQAKGKIVESVQFSASPNHHDLSIRFKDKSGFNFTIQTGFTLKTEYSDWTSGEQRILRVWPLFKN